MTVHFLVDQQSRQMNVTTLPAIANASGGTGAAVTTAVSITSLVSGDGVSPMSPGGVLPPGYVPMAIPSQAAFVSIINKTNTGFNVVLTPTTSSASISAGTFDVLIVV